MVKINDICKVRLATKERRYGRAVFVNYRKRTNCCQLVSERDCAWSHGILKAKVTAPRPYTNEDRLPAPLPEAAMMRYLAFSNSGFFFFCWDL